MGHFYVDMFPNGEDSTFDQEYAKYKGRCRTEISTLIEGNPISFEAVNIGDKLILYTPLEGVSKVSFRGQPSCKIREYFNSRFKLFGIEMWALAYGKKFQIYAKQKKESVTFSGEKTIIYEVRIDKPKETFQHFLSWIDVRFFEKIS